MFRNYLRIAFRNLQRNTAFTAINIFGLAAGLASCLLIMLYILDESGYDKFENNGDRIFRIASITNKGETWAASAAPLAAGLKKALPEVVQSARLMTFPDIAKMLLKNSDASKKKQFFESNGYYVDSNFLLLFSYNLLYGDINTALNEPNSIVISHNISRKFFGDLNPVGKPISINTPFGEFNYTIKGVFESDAYKSHIPANYFLSMRNNDMWNWVQSQTTLVGNNVFYTYLQLKEGISQKKFEAKLQDYFMKHAGTDMAALGFSLQLFLQPLSDIYLRSAMGNEIGANGNITYLYILGSIAAFILLIACINFMNLSTARSEKRAKEVGVRKVMGAERGAIITQFLGESFLMASIALVIALLLVHTILPYFNNLTQKNILFKDGFQAIGWVAGLTLFTGLLSGLYPAFYLSAFKPVSVLKGRIVNSFSATALRKGLVIFQFTISVCLVFAAIVIWKQLDYLDKQKLGFNKDRKLILPLQAGYLNNETNYSSLKNELVKFPEVKSVSSGSTYPGIINYTDMLFFSEGKSKQDNVDVHLAAIENGYIETLGLQMVGGRAFSREFTGDSNAIILNETALKQFGYKLPDAIGKKISFDIGNYRGTMNIVGVVKDFNFESLHKKIEPFAYTTSIFANKYGYMVMDLTASNYGALLKKIGDTWAKLNPSVPFEYSFLDQDFQRNYEKDHLTSNIVVCFTIIAIIIACLGLFGLSAFAAEQRSKEIGIRKVLGASTGIITGLLSRDFLKLVIIAIIIALPIAWWAMDQWLLNFAFRATINWWIFAVAGLCAILIAQLTISYQAIKAAIVNPIESLRAE